MSRKYSMKHLESDIVQSGILDRERTLIYEEIKMIEKGKKAELEQYQCSRCGRFFYIDVNDKSDLDIDGYFCPYNCIGILTVTPTNFTRKVIMKIEEIEG